MFKPHPSIYLLVLFGPELFGCINLKSYINPQSDPVGYSQLDPSKKGPPISIDVEFQRGGKHFGPAVDQAQATVQRVLTKTGTFREVRPRTAKQAGSVRISVTINNAGGQADGSGVATGMTFGAVSTHTIDNYQITITFQSDAAQVFKREYRDSIYSVIGAGSVPSGSTSMSATAAFDAVVERSLLRFVRALQNSGAL